MRLAVLLIGLAGAGGNTPNPALTPGAVASTDLAEICASDGKPGSAYSRAHRR